MKEGLSYATAERRIKDAIYLGDIFNDKLKKQARICLKEFK